MNLQTALPPPNVSSADTAARVRQVELLISNLLRFGVIVSLALIICGTILTFIHHPAYVSSPTDLQRLTQPGATFPHTAHDVIAGVCTLRGEAITTVGLLVLIATPIMRVAVSIFAFIYQHDRIFMFITTLVLCLLLLSFVLGKGE